MFDKFFELSHSYSSILNRIRALTLTASFLPLTLSSTVIAAEERLDNLKHHENATQEIALDSLNRSGGRVIPPQQIAQMSQELSRLIDRFSSTLLTAEANNELPTSDRIANSKSKQALIKAKKKLQQFHELIAQNNYSQARQQWIEARRILWDNYPTNTQLARSEIRAIWLDRGTIVKAKSEADLAKIFDRLAKAGINTVFFETVNSSYPIYPSKIAPEQNPLVKNWDPLKAAVKLAHERDMELHAWVWIFAAANQRHNTILNQPQNYLGPVLSAHPDWAMKDKRGNIFHHSSKKAFFDPANPAVKRYLSSLLEEIVTNYQVDGIQLDYIRYPFQNPARGRTYGYGIAARKQFQQLTGVDPVRINSRHHLWSQWDKFRIQQIDNFVASVADNLKQKNPDLILSTAVFPISQQKRLSTLQQNWEEWVRQDWIDILVPMTYALNTEKLQQIIQPVLDKSQQGTTLLLPGIRLLNVPDVIAVDQMQLLRNISAGGYALFAVENLNSNLEQIFSRTQGSTDKPLPHRQPFQATAYRFQALQREWNWLLNNDGLSLEEITVTEWNQEAQRLAETLQRLADQPSLKNLLTAKLAISSFQQKFPHWMEQTEAVSSYQKEAWLNRLATLDKILSYGERRVFASQSNNTEMMIGDR